MYSVYIPYAQSGRPVATKFSLERDDWMAANTMKDRVCSPRKRIIAIAGSNNKHSQTYRLLHLWLRRMAELDSTVEYEVLLLRDFHIALCEDCRSCHACGGCALDQTDDMPLLRRKLQENDIVIFSSPVSHQNMSSIMKNFIDRVDPEPQLARLAGRLGFTLTTTTSSGGKFVSDMLWHSQTSFGIKNIDNFVFRAVCDDEQIASDTWAKAAVEALHYQAGLSAQVPVAKGRGVV